MVAQGLNQLVAVYVAGRDGGQDAALEDALDELGLFDGAHPLSRLFCYLVVYAAVTSL